MAQQTAVEWFAKEILSYKNPTNISGTDYILIPINKVDFLETKAKQMEREQERQKLIGLLDWMNKVAADNPMAFENDHDDIVDMYLNGYYK